MDITAENFNNIKILLNKVANSGADEVDPIQMKELKHFCRRSEANVEYVFELVLKLFQKKHAQIKFSCFNICIHLFERSHYFRCQFLRNFSDIVDFIFISKKANFSLQPKAVAKKLKRKFCLTLHHWALKYGKAYPALFVGINYLKNSKNVDIYATESQMQQLHGIEPVQISTRISEAETISLVTAELNESVSDIEADLSTIRNGFHLLIPTLDNFLFDDSDPSQSLEDTQRTSEISHASVSEYDDEVNSEHNSDGAGSSSVSKGMIVKIDLAAIHSLEETQDNSTIIDSVKDHAVILRKKWLPLINKLILKLKLYTATNKSLFTKLLELKESVQAELTKFSSLKIIPMQSELDNVKHSVDSDDDFVDVDGNEEKLTDPLQSEAILLGVLTQSPCHKDGSSSSGFGTRTSNKLRETEKKVLLQADPCQLSNDGPVMTKKSRRILRCDDLILNMPWLLANKDSEQINSKNTPENFAGEWTPPVPCVNPLAGLSQVWLADSNRCEGDFVRDGSVSSCTHKGVFGIGTVAVNVVTKQNPVTWHCRTPLPSGRLCPRMDKMRCPLHGPLIPRSSQDGDPDILLARAILMRARQQADEERHRSLRSKVNSSGRGTTESSMLSVASSGASLSSVDTVAEDASLQFDSSLSPLSSCKSATGSREESKDEVGKNEAPFIYVEIGLEKYVELFEDSYSDQNRKMKVTRLGTDLSTSIDDSSDEDDSNNDGCSPSKMSDSMRGKAIVEQKQAERKSLCKKLNLESGTIVNSVLSSGSKCLPQDTNNTLSSMVQINENISDHRRESYKFFDCNNSLINDEKLSIGLLNNMSEHEVVQSSEHRPRQSVLLPADAVFSATAAMKLLELVRKAHHKLRLSRMNLDQDWQNPKLLASLKRSTGLDLNIMNAKKRKRVRGGLTALRQQNDTPRRRLAKKVLNKSDVAKLEKTRGKI